MPLRILVAPDKFKGTLTAQEAATAIATGWRAIRPEDEMDLAPISDGGDGFGPILSHALGAKAIRTKTVNAAHQPVTATWWWSEESRTAVIESANIIGLAMLPRDRFHPFELDTQGLAKVLHAAAKKGARRCLVGIGGSATNDGGFGMAQALGWQFQDCDGELIHSWPELSKLQRVTAPKPKRIIPSITVAVDVQNRLLGKLGCSRIYGPQKGLLEADMPGAERALRRLAKVSRGTSERNLANEPGSGAAGGLGFGLCQFASAQMKPGFAMIADALKLRARLRRADLVITGEGSLDDSTAMGKGVGELALMAQSCSVPILGLAGQISSTPKLSKLFARLSGLTEITSSSAALSRPQYWLTRLANDAARQWQR
ncbi:MAG: glycerate kinase [Limisphaerales bacterium]|jgi:glycerate kinase